MASANNNNTLRGNTNVLYYGDDITSLESVGSVYLDGPKNKITASRLSWRKKLIEVFNAQGYNHTIVIPECRDNTLTPPYGTDEFYQWENYAMNACTYIMFWIPRESPLFTGKDINDRWGEWKLRKNVILGFPKRSEEMAYQSWYAKTRGITMVHHLENMVQYIKEQINQYMNLEIVFSDGEVSLPYDENVIHNELLMRLIRRTPDFIKNAARINVPMTNLVAMQKINEMFNWVYQPSSTVNNTIVFTRRSDYSAALSTDAALAADATQQEQTVFVNTRQATMTNAELLALKQKLILFDDEENSISTPIARNPKAIDGENFTK
jgi:hypothetical protein